MLIVKKFGGSSVANKDRIFNVAKRCIEDYRAGHDVVVVLSAMGDTTDELIALANTINPDAKKRELDMLLTTGEDVYKRQTMMGEIVSPFLFSHEVFGEGFYMVEVDVKRLSNSKDRIPLMISERLIDVSKDYTGEFIMVNGQFRSYNRHEEMKNRLDVYKRQVSA